MVRPKLLLTATAVILAGCGSSPTTPPPPTEPPTEPPVTPAPPMPPSDPQCAANRTGRPHTGAIDPRSLTTRIVGGTETVPGDFPFAAAIVLDRPGGGFFQYCGGALIAPGWVLTAAHCQVEKRDHVILGRHDLGTSAGTVHDIDFVLTHSDYDDRTNDNDIALVRLADPSQQAPLGLVDPGGTRPGDASTVIGWGALSEGGSSSDTLQRVAVPLRSTSECEQAYSASAITDNMLCAGFDAGQQDSCQGDSGGPLMVRAASGEFRQAGIVSWGQGCARPGKYGVYTRVENYLDWIAACQASPP